MPAQQKLLKKKIVKGELWEKKNRARAFYYPDPVFLMLKINLAQVFARQKKKKTCKEP